MSTKGIIIATFVRKNKILSFLERLRNEFKIGLSRVFVYKVDTNTSEYLVTFKAFDRNEYIGKIENATVMHVKNGSLFSINALNKLIDREKDGDEKPNNEFVLDWSKYRDKLIIQVNGELRISNLKKIQDFMYKRSSCKHFY